MRSVLKLDRGPGWFILEVVYLIQKILVSDQTPVSLNWISHSFESRRVLSEFSFSFGGDKVIAILGKSGSGKSTLLQIVNGMIKPDQGEVLLFGEPINYSHVRALRLQMGYVVQQVGLFPHMDVESNICLLGRITNRPKEFIRKRLFQLLDTVQLPRTWLKKYPHELSGGEQQRVGLCRAMFLDPPILLMDEPFASLDYETKHSIYKHIVAMQHTQPRTIILVTHDWEEAVTLADQFIWLEEAKIKESGDHHHLKELKTQLFSKL